MKTENFSENSFYKYLIDNGYLFDKYVVENFLLSLKVKSFVIFTGNSGTGKTKLSQLFSKFFKEYYYDDEDYLTVQVKSNFSSWSNQSWTLSPIFFERIFPIKESQITFNMNVDGIPAVGSLYPTIQLKYYSDELKNYFKEKFDENQDQDIDLKIEYDSLRNLRSDDYIDSEQSMQLIQKSNKSSYEDRQWMANKAIYDYTPFNQGQIPCNIVVNGIKSQGDMRIIFKLSYKKNEVLQKYLKQNLGKEVKIIIDVDDWDFKDFKSDLDLEESDKRLDKNYRIVPVGANWTDNTNIVGITHFKLSTTFSEICSIRYEQKKLKSK
ncbi:hypothetical protein [Methanobrevibacter thaueri]|nr:hypothetical protein [Methanobrevibacter thaueri]